MGVWFTSDLHLGHRNITKYRPRFSSMVENDEYMLSMIEALGKRDILIILGDFLFDSDEYARYADRLSKVSCRIRLVMGNHDSLKLMQESWIEHKKPLATYKNYWLSHCPIHPQELRNRLGNIHGHLHSDSIMIDSIPDLRYFNVNIEDNGYKFVNLDTIKEYFNGNS
jgi:calcineurin-like phosphoesterase family protein